LPDQLPLFSITDPDSEIIQIPFNITLDYKCRFLLTPLPARLPAGIPTPLFFTFPLPANILTIKALCARQTREKKRRAGIGILPTSHPRGVSGIGRLEQYSGCSTIILGSSFGSSPFPVQVSSKHRQLSRCDFPESDFDMKIQRTGISESGAFVDVPA